MLLTQCHSDPTKDRVLLSQQEDRRQITRLIDCGDVEIGYRDYESVPFHLAAFRGDGEGIGAFLGAYDYPNRIDSRFKEHTVVYSTLHRYLHF